MKQFLKAFVKLDSAAERFKGAQNALLSQYAVLSEEEKLVVNSTPLEIAGIEFSTVGDFVASAKSVEVEVIEPVVEEVVEGVVEEPVSEV